MTWTGFVLAAGLTLGQPPQRDNPPTASPPGRTEEVVRAEKAAELAEDVEVMRRILNKALGLQNEPTTLAATLLDLSHGATMPDPHGTRSPYGSTGSTLNYPYPMTNTVRLADPFDGVYLKGHGAVYTLKIKAGEQYADPEVRRHAGLAVGCTTCHAAVPVPTARLEPVDRTRAELTEWDRTRNALRGEKESAPPEPAPTVDPQDVCRPGKLTEALVTALMKNGRHIRHLTAGEAVTVVVTLDGLYGPARAVVSLDGNPAEVDFFREGFAQATPLPNPSNRPAAPPRPTAAAFTEEEAKQIILGDLHMKQNRPKEAVAAYRAALARVGLGKVPRVAGADLADDHDIGEAIRQARQKLALALVAAGDFGEAKKAIDAAAIVRFDNDRPAQPPPGAAAKALPVPAKLILTVKKADLDRAETLSPAEFKKLVTVETVGLPPADQPKK